jgi:hypothetical protein
MILRGSELDALAAKKHRASLRRIFLAPGLILVCLLALIGAVPAIFGVALIWAADAIVTWLEGGRA